MTLNEQQEEQQERRGGGIPFGWIIFLLLMFGGPLLRFVQSWWSSLSASAGLSIGPGMLPWLVGGLVAVVAIVVALRTLSNAGAPSSSSMPPNTSWSGRMTGPAQPRPGLPTTPPTWTPPAQPTMRGLPPARVPTGPPRFEPIVEPRLLLIGLVGLGLLGAAWLLLDPRLLSALLP